MPTHRLPFMLITGGAAHAAGQEAVALSIDERTGIHRVGPQSSGDIPCPFCYGRGGFLPTITLMIRAADRSNFFVLRMRFRKW